MKEGIDKKEIERVESKAKKLASNIDYDAIEIRLVDEEGNVKIKGAMKVEDMMKFELFNGDSKDKVVSMFYLAIENDLKQKLKNEKNEEKEV